MGDYKENNGSIILEGIFSESDISGGRMELFQLSWNDYAYIKDIIVEYENDIFSRDYTSSLHSKTKTIIKPETIDKLITLVYYFLRQNKHYIMHHFEADYVVNNFKAHENEFTIDLYKKIRKLCQ